MNTIQEIFSGKSIVAAGAVSMMLLAGCARDRVLTERPYIPAPTDQIPSEELAALPPVDALPPVIVVDPAPVPEFPPFQEPKVEPLTYKVQKGDSFWKIASMHGVSMQELAAFNNMDLKTTLKSGAILRIPPGGALLPPEKLEALKTTVPQKAKPPARVDKAVPPPDGIYTVKSGDSLWKIAKRFNTSVAKLAAANNLDIKVPLQVGQKIRISGPAPTEAPAARIPAAETIKTAVEEPIKPDIHVDENQEIVRLEDIMSEADMKLLNEEISRLAAPAPRPGPMLEDLKISHDVERGETWQSIANLYGVKLDDLRKANPSASGAEPVPGTKIVIPDLF